MRARPRPTRAHQMGTVTIISTTVPESFDPGHPAPVSATVVNNSLAGPATFNLDWAVNGEPVDTVMDATLPPASSQTFSTTIEIPSAGQATVCANIYDVVVGSESHDPVQRCATTDVHGTVDAILSPQFFAVVLGGLALGWVAIQVVGD